MSTKANEGTKRRVAVMASGLGSNLEAILRAVESGRLATAEVAVVASDRPEAFALERARQREIPTLLLPWGGVGARQLSREQYDAELARRLQAFRPELVVLAGWMRILSMAFLSHFPGRVINLHPARPGELPGKAAIERAFQAFGRGELHSSGVTVHWVPDEGVDTGPPVLWETVPLFPSDSLESFRFRVHQVEHRLIVEAIRRILQGEAQPPTAVLAASQPALQA